MIRKHCFRKYGHIESLIQDFNESIGYLNSFLSVKISEIVGDAKIKDVQDIHVKLNNKGELKLEDELSIPNCKTVNNIAEAIKYSAKNDKCYDIDCVWRKSRDICEELKKTIDDFAKAVNALSDEEIVNDNTTMRQILKICNDNDYFPYNIMDEQRMKNILNNTVDISYKSSQIVKYAGLGLLFVILAILLLAFCSCSNKKNDNSYGGRISISLFKDDGKATFEHCLCDSIVIGVERNDSIVIDRSDTLCLATSLHIFLMNKCKTIKDTIICLSNKFEYKVTDSSFNKIVVVRVQRCNSSISGTAVEDNGCSYNIVLPLIKYGFLIIALVVLLVFFARPLITKAIEDESRGNEKILNEKLRVQNEWQQILQDRYRLENRRAEIDLNAIERESKNRIEEQIRRKEHHYQMEIKEKDIDLEKYRIMFSAQNSERQMLDKRMRDFNEQIVKLMSNINQ